MPQYYRRAEGGYSGEWIRMAKRAMASLLPRYDASRMLGEYVSKYYLPAARQGLRYAENGYEAARTIAAWKATITPEIDRTVDVWFDDLSVLVAEEGRTAGARTAVR